MTLRNVTLTAVAALSLGMAAHAQTTITVPLNEPGTVAPAPTGPGTTVTRQPDGTSTVESTGTVPRNETNPTVLPQPPAIGFTGATPDAPSTSAPADTSGTGSVPQRTGQPRAGSTGVVGQGESTGEPADTTGTTSAPVSTDGADATPDTPANPEAATDTQATPDTPAPAADLPEAAEAAQTGTAAGPDDAVTPTPSDVPGEPPAAPAEGLPAEASEAQVTAPVPAAEGAVEADAPDTDVPASPAEAVSEADQPTAEPEAEAAVTEAPAEEAPAEAELAPAEEAPAAIQNPEVEQTEGTDVDAGAATEPAAEEAPAEAPAAAEAGADSHAAPHQEIRDVAFSFEGPFGTYDQFQLQRGLQIYTEVCAGCHGMKQVPLRTLSDPDGPGLPEDQMRAYAAQMSVVDAETGEERPREPTDMFPTVVGEGMGPDLSLMAKARAGFHGPYGTGISQLLNGTGGPEYIYSILTGYTGEEMEQAGTVLYGNTAFPGGWISMAPPLSDDSVTFEDGSPTDLDSLAKDVAAFLMWTAEPKMMDRKQAGLVSVLFLILLSVLLYLTNKRLWWPLKHRQDTPGDSR